MLPSIPEPVDPVGNAEPLKSNTVAQFGGVFGGQASLDPNNEFDRFLLGNVREGLDRRARTNQPSAVYNKNSNHNPSVNQR